MFLRESSFELLSYSMVCFISACLGTSLVTLDTLLDVLFGYGLGRIIIYPCNHRLNCASATLLSN